MLDPKEEKVDGDVNEGDIDKTSESQENATPETKPETETSEVCLLYTSDAADD